MIHSWRSASQVVVFAREGSGTALGFSLRERLEAHVHSLNGHDLDILDDIKYTLKSCDRCAQKQQINAFARQESIRRNRKYASMSQGGS